MTAGAAGVNGRSLPSDGNASHPMGMPACLLERKPLSAALRFAEKAGRGDVAVKGGGDDFHVMKTRVRTD
jgi:hypothetical protein